METGNVSIYTTDAKNAMTKTLYFYWSNAETESGRLSYLGNYLYN